MPPATNINLNDEASPLAEVCQGEHFVRHSHVEVKQCAMHADDFSGEECENSAVDGSDFCAEHIGVKLCKASGIQYQFEGNSTGDFLFLKTVPAHPVDPCGTRTKRAVFCFGDRCRNLWRDTKQSRERQIEVRKIENGERSERYALINNFRNSGQEGILDKQTGRVVDRSI